MKRYLKFFLFLSIYFGIFMGIFYSIQYGYFEGLYFGIISGLFFGIFTTIFVRYKHRQSIKQLGFDISEKTYDPVQARQLDLNVPYNKAYDFCLKFVHLMKKGRIKTEDRSKGIINARIGMKWHRNPCVILFRLQKIDNHRTHIDVLSKPTIPTAIVDVGTSLEYVTLILNFLNRQENRFLAARKPVPRKTSRGMGASHRRHGTGGGYASRVDYS